MDMLVGTFNAGMFTLHFGPPTSDARAQLSVVRPHPSIAGHNWLALSKDQKFLYATAWTKPQPAVAAYAVNAFGRQLQFLNAKHVNALPGYVCCTDTHVYSVGGPTGEIFRIEADGSIGELVQTLDFVGADTKNVSKERGEVAHGDFGGLRHGSHSVDLSPDGRSMYVADIGRNCIWSYSVSQTKSLVDPPLGKASKHLCPRSHDGPRHTWPHPNGKVLYSLQEHSNMVDVFSIAEDGTTLQHVQGVRILPEGKNEAEYWADEVRVSTSPNPARPRYMYASTRGLGANTMGYVAAYALNEDGTVTSETAIHIWETPTSGGLANAINPAPRCEGQDESIEYLAMTDSQEGWVFMLSFDGKVIEEVARVNLGKTEEGDVNQAATAVWFEPIESGSKVNFAR